MFRVVSRRFAVVAAATLAAALLTACSTSSSSTGGSSGSGPTAWQAVLGQIRPDGTVTASTALAAFAVAIGPVPGANPPAGAQQPIESGTLAVSWVLAHWGELTEAQHVAIRTALGAPTSTDKPAGYVLPARALSATPAPSSSPPQNPNIACLNADSAGAAKYRAWMPGIESAISSHLGRPLTIDAHTFIAVNTKDLIQPSLMYTYPCGISGDAVTGCTIHINPNAVSGSYPDDQVRSFLIHEVTHCYLNDKFGVFYDAMPPWYVEGVPTWTMSVLGVNNARLSSKWTSYLDNPGKPLSQRSYDAVGFFAHLAETGTDPWGVIDPIGSAMSGNNLTANGWTAAKVTSDFLDSWGTGFVQGRHPGTPWTSGGPSLPPYTPALPNGQFGNGSTLSIPAQPYAAAVETVDVNASVVLVNPGAGTAGRMTLDGGSDTDLGTGGPFCTLAQCSCPAGSPGEGTTFTHMDSGQQYVGLTGGPAAGSLALVGMSLPDYCQKPPKTCLIGQWTGVNFDVHADSITETGGAGVTLHIDPHGNLTVSFNGMQPITFQGTAASSTFTGTFTYTGTVSGQIKLPSPGATSGNWVYAGTANISGLTASVHLVSPVSMDLPSLDLSALAGLGGGVSGAISSDPMVSGGWQCSGNTLVTLPPPNATVTGTWTLTRTGPG
jgi:hypothetical protein